MTALDNDNQYNSWTSSLPCLDKFPYSGTGRLWCVLLHMKMPIENHQYSFLIWCWCLLGLLFIFLDSSLSLLNRTTGLIYQTDWLLNVWVANKKSYSWVLIALVRVSSFSWTLTWLSVIILGYEWIVNSSIAFCYRYI